MSGLRLDQLSDFGRLAVMLSGAHYLTGLNLPASGGMQLTRSPRQDETPLAPGFVAQ